MSQRIDKNAPNRIALRIDNPSINPLVYITNLKQVLRAKLTLSSHTGGGPPGTVTTTTVLVFTLSAYFLLLFKDGMLQADYPHQSSFTTELCWPRRRNRPVAFAIGQFGPPPDDAGQIAHAKLTSQIRQRNSITPSSTANTFSR